MLFSFTEAFKYTGHLLLTLDGMRLEREFAAQKSRGTKGNIVKKTT
jgi:hypothetical protein